MTDLWSTRIERHYSLRLSDDVRAWLDEGRWQDECGAEFRLAQSPEQWLDPPPGAIWAGFMLPDTLPIISNDYGDWLCLRIGADGTVTELVQWSHGGGDWIPYGRTLAEGLMYDAARQLLHPDRSSPANPGGPITEDFQAAVWAARWLPSARPLSPFWNHAGKAATDGVASQLLDEFAHSGIAEFAVHRDRILRYLGTPLKARSAASWAADAGVSWEPEFVSWLFDTARIPSSARQQLTLRLADTDGAAFAQDWPAAEAEALAVIGRRSDLGWAFDVAGWAAERRGDAKQAVAHYWAGLQTSWFSDDTLQFRSHWFDEGYGKFAASRLAELTAHLSPEQLRDPYLRIFLDNDAQSLRSRVQQYWIELARRAVERRAYCEAYHYYYRAGWDLGMLPISAYEEVFQQLQRVAEADGSPALAAIARLHHRFLY
jgi:hypothetical protein